MTLKRATIVTFFLLISPVKIWFGLTGIEFSRTWSGESKRNWAQLKCQRLACSRVCVKARGPTPACPLPRFASAPPKLRAEPKPVATKPTGLTSCRGSSISTCVWRPIEPIGGTFPFGTTVGRNFAFLLCTKPPRTFVVNRQRRPAFDRPRANLVVTWSDRSFE